MFLRDVVDKLARLLPSYGRIRIHVQKEATAQNFTPVNSATTTEEKAQRDVYDELLLSFSLLTSSGG
jgi:hypothetical protein